MIAGIGGDIDWGDGSHGGDSYGGDGDGDGDDSHGGDGDSVERFLLSILFTMLAVSILHPHYQIFSKFYPQNAYVVFFVTFATKMR